MGNHCSPTLGLGLCVGEGTLAHPAALWLHCPPLAICVSWDFQLCLESVLPGSLPRKYGFGDRPGAHGHSTNIIWGEYCGAAFQPPSGTSASQWSLKLRLHSDSSFLLICSLEGSSVLEFQPPPREALMEFQATGFSPAQPQLLQACRE